MIIKWAAEKIFTAQITFCLNDGIVGLARAPKYCSPSFLSSTSSSSRSLLLSFSSSSSSSSPSPSPSPSPEPLPGGEQGHRHLRRTVAEQVGRPLGPLGGRRGRQSYGMRKRACTRRAAICTVRVGITDCVWRAPVAIGRVARVAPAGSVGHETECSAVASQRPSLRRPSFYTPREPRASSAGPRLKTTPSSSC